MKTKKPHKPKKPVRKNTKSKPVEITEPVLTAPLKEQFLLFIEYHPAKRLSRNIRSMLIDWLMYENSTEVFYLKDLLYDLEGLFELLEAIQEEMGEDNPG